MSTWALLVLATAGAGALLLLHGITKYKATSELLLREYENLLGKARQRAMERSQPHDVDEPPTAAPLEPLHPPPRHQG